MSSLENTYKAFFDCLRERRWGDLGTFLHPQFTKNDKQYTPDSFAAEPQADTATEIELIAVTTDEKGLRLASTILVKWKPSGNVMGFDPPRDPIIFTDQQFNWFVDGKLFKTISMPDREEVSRQLSGHEGARRRWEEIASTHNEQDVEGAAVGPSQPNLSASNLAAVYREYFDCVNKRTLADRWGSFVGAQVIFNGTVLTLEEYRQKVESVITVFPDLLAEVYTVIADEGTQRVAAQLEFSGTMVKPLAGVEGTGGQARFAEHCTYEFRDGKIARLWSIATWGRLGQTTLE